MKQSKRKKLERAGFKVGAVQEFLQLPDQEMSSIDSALRSIHLGSRFEDFLAQVGIFTECRASAIKLQSAQKRKKRIARRIATRSSRLNRRDPHDRCNNGR